MKLIKSTPGGRTYQVGGFYYEFWAKSIHVTMLFYGPKVTTAGDVHWESSKADIIKKPLTEIDFQLEIMLRRL